MSDKLQCSDTIQRSHQPSSVQCINVHSADQLSTTRCNSASLEPTCWRPALTFVLLDLQALQQWSSLQRHWCQHSPLSILQQLEAAESAGWLLQRLVTQQALQQMLCEGDVQELQQQSEVGVACMSSSLGMAAAVRCAASRACQGCGMGQEQLIFLLRSRARMLNRRSIEQRLETVSICQKHKL